MSTPCQATPITERANNITAELDAASAPEIVNLLKACDAELFHGFESFPSILDKHTELLVNEATLLAIDTLTTLEDTAVILAGAGTSGRLAYLAACSFNGVLAQQGRDQRFHHIIAGGDKALERAQEGAEDNDVAAVMDLQQIEEARLKSGRPPYKKIFYVGISCGLSATYIAAQLEYAMGNPRYAVALIGFNPVEMARKHKVAGYAKSFHDVAIILHNLSCSERNGLQNYFVINPVVGPEAVCGSSRLKGGSASKILLEAIFARALMAIDPRSCCLVGVRAEKSAASGKKGLGKRQLTPYEGMIRSYEDVHREVYSHASALANLMEAGAQSLSAGGSIYYVAAGSAGVLALIDASEQVPTFGALPSDVQAFALGGWAALSGGREALPLTKSCMQMSDVISDAGAGMRSPTAATAAMEQMPFQTAGGYTSRSSVAHFLTSVLPSIRRTSVIFLLQTGSAKNKLPSQILSAVARAQARVGFRLAVVFISCACHDDDAWQSLSEAFKDAQIKLDVVLQTANPSLCQSLGVFLEELGLKYVLNAISSGAHVLVGKVYGSLMIDLRISNHKLFRRAVAIISQVAGVTASVAEKCLLQAIYGGEESKPGEAGRGRNWQHDEARTNIEILEHVTAAAAGERVVPVAILMAAGKLSYQSARIAAQDKGLTVRAILTSHVK